MHESVCVRSKTSTFSYCQASYKFNQVHSTVYYVWDTHKRAQFRNNNKREREIIKIKRALYVYLLAESCCTVCFCNLHCLHCERAKTRLLLPPSASSISVLLLYKWLSSTYETWIDICRQTQPHSCIISILQYQNRSANEAIYHEEQTTGVFFAFRIIFFVFVNSLCAMLLSFFLSVNIFYPLCSLRFTAIIHLSVCVVQRVRVYCIQCTHNGKTLLKHNTEQWIIINYELFNSSVYSQRDHRMCLISSFSLFGSLALWLSMYN